MLSKTLIDKLNQNLLKLFGSHLMKHPVLTLLNHVINFYGRLLQGFAYVLFAVLLL